MIKLIRFIFTGSWHDHKFEVIQKNTLSEDGHLIGWRIVSRCSECGKIKHTDCV